MTKFKVEVLADGEWIQLQTLEAESIETQPVVYDDGGIGFHKLKAQSGKKTQVRVNDEQSTYVLMLDDRLRLEPGKVGFCLLSLLRPVQLPDGAVITTVPHKTPHAVASH